jgi:hypothetical protein
MLSNSNNPTSHTARRGQINHLARKMRGKEAFVWVEPGKTGYRMIGMFVPGMPMNGVQVTNRFVVPDKDCPAWFTELCKDLTSGKIPDMMVRVKLVGIAGDVMAFVAPKARDREHALQEWERYRKEFSVGRLTFPRPNMSPALHCRFAYEIFVNDMNSCRHMLQTQQRWDIVDYMAGPADEPYSQALVVNRRTGALILMTGAMTSKDLIPDWNPDVKASDLLFMEPIFHKAEKVISIVKQHISWEHLREPKELITLIEAQHKHIAA